MKKLGASKTGRLLEHERDWVASLTERSIS
jgi:hypothetical protein